MVNKNDLRYIKTEETIRRAFYLCVRQSNFEKTKISDICKLAKISRNTFYDHYEDKYALLDRLFEELKEEFQKSFTKKLEQEIVDGEVRGAVAWYVDIVWKNREFYGFLLECSMERFLEVLKEAVIHGPRRNMTPDYDVLSEDICVQLLLEYMFHGMIGFTRVWLRSKPVLPREQVVEELYIMCEHLVKLHSRKLSELTEKRKKQKSR